MRGRIGVARPITSDDLVWFPFRILSLVTPWTVPTGCPSPVCKTSPNPTNFITTCFIFTNKTWTEAQQYCREKHTYLATVTNMKDMKRLINISAGDQSEAWIGLNTKPEFTRTWFWSLSGEKFDESEKNWNNNEPTDRGIQGSENCGIDQQMQKSLSAN
uniref:C-type lectin domain-containing protein n=1 Tax=Xiphophorus couchianus TaxID=32473 RepID=A0A3B5L008_9TELE